MLLEIAKERGVTAAQVALNWVISKPCVGAVLVGARNEAQLRDNLATAQWSLTAEEVARLDAASATPEPYPNWHHRRFAAERNPALPSMRTPLSTDINPMPKETSHESQASLVAKN